MVAIHVTSGFLREDLLEHDALMKQTSQRGRGFESVGNYRATSEKEARSMDGCSLFMAPGYGNMYQESLRRQEGLNDGLCRPGEAGSFEAPLQVSIGDCVELFSKRLGGKWVSATVCSLDDANVKVVFPSDEPRFMKVLSRKSPEMRMKTLAASEGVSPRDDAVAEPVAPRGRRKTKKVKHASRKGVDASRKRTPSPPASLSSFSTASLNPSCFPSATSTSSYLDSLVKEVNRKDMNGSRKRTPSPPASLSSFSTGSLNPLCFRSATSTSSCVDSLVMGASGKDADASRKQAPSRAASVSSFTTQSMNSLPNMSATGASGGVDEVTPMTPEELSSALRSGSSVEIFDVGDFAFFDRRIPGARHAPYVLFDQRVWEIGKEFADSSKLLVFYGSSTESHAVRCAERLIRHFGRNCPQWRGQVCVLEGGFEGYTEFTAGQ